VILEKEPAAEVGSVDEGAGASMGTAVFCFLGIDTRAVELSVEGEGVVVVGVEGKELIGAPFAALRFF